MIGPVIGSKSCLTLSFKCGAMSASSAGLRFSMSCEIIDFNSVSIVFLLRFLVNGK